MSDFRRDVNLRNGCSSERHGERMNCADREIKREMMGKKGGRRERECFLLALLRGEFMCGDACKPSHCTFSL